MGLKAKFGSGRARSPSKTTAPSSNVARTSVRKTKASGSIKPAGKIANDGVQLFDKVATEVLHGHRHLFDGLNQSEQDLVIDWMADALVDGEADNALHDVLWELDFIRKPASIEDFIYDEYYLGRILAEMSKPWFEDLQHIFAPGSRVFEWVMTGAIGIGKTTTAMIAVLYKLHYLMCLRNPAQYYGLLPDSLILFGLYSLTKRQVSESGYFTIRGWVDSSPFFHREFPRSKKIDSKCDFSPTTGKNVQVISGSQELHAIGLNLFAFAMDEVNFMREKQDKTTGEMAGQAYGLYNSVHARIQSRFIRPGGTIPGLMILMSSRKAQTSFLEEHMKKRKDDPHTHISDYALWETKDPSRFQLPRFRVEVGDRFSPSRIIHSPAIRIIHDVSSGNMGLNEAKKLGKQITESDYEEARPHADTIDIPGEFLRTFEEDVDQGLRDIAGRATFNLNPLIRDRGSVFDAQREHMVHPFSKDTLTIGCQDDVQLIDYLNLRALCRTQHGRWQPRLNPTAPRFMHCDIAYAGDAYGIAMGHVSGMVKTQRNIIEDGTTITVEAPFIIIDFMLRVVSPPGDEVELAKCRAFINYIANYFKLQRVTFDGFQSKDSMQMLAKSGIETGLKSVDKTDAAYLSLRQAHFERRIAMYNYEWYVDEVLDLQRDANKGKVDHPTKSSKGGKGSKDVADAVAGVVEHCITDDRALKAVQVLGPAAGSVQFSNSRIVLPDAQVEQDAANVKQIGGVQRNWESLRGNV